MGDIAEAFEQHLRSLSDDDWNALVTRVRTDDTKPSTSPGDAGRAEATRRFGKDQHQ
ncbi:hypothetical protein [Mycobacterium shigaense]|uniref:hypothetical protein n=1 Tax=Mycobacterium shigaense TaxID=722731 RepID=UPI002AE018B9|nr:hypothetical protein [Mycobacterium shigaense]MEA1123890.1 hypothetical protein [Mycobacterium shigaense]